MKRIILITILIIIFTINTAADTIQQRPKDPLLAGVLSWYMPGLGQFYSGRYLKGSVFWIVENSLLISTIITVADLNFSIDEEIGFQFSIKPKDDLTQQEKTLGISLTIAYVAFHIINVVDAIQSVNSDNRILRNREKEQENSKIFLNYNFAAADNYVSMNYKF